MSSDSLSVAEEFYHQKIRLSKKTREELLDALIHANRRYQRGTDAVDAVASELLGIHRTDARCLDILEEAGRMTAGALADAAGLSPGAITSVLDRLERAGYARRARDTADRRRVLVEITQRAREAAMQIYGPIGELAEPDLDRLSDADLRRITAFLEIGARVQNERAAQLREQLERDGRLR